MTELFLSSYFWIGLLVGAGVSIYFYSTRKPSNKLSVGNAKTLAEELQKRYREEDLEGIEAFKKEYLEGKERYIFGKEKPSPFQLWCAIVLYVAHRYADYDFNEYDSQEWHEIVEKTFGNKSFVLSKFDAVNELLNGSTKFYLSYIGWIKERKEDHLGVQDYADVKLYDMMAYILDSSIADAFSFGTYSDTPDPEDAYDHGSYLRACLLLKEDNNVEAIKYLEKAAISGMPEAQVQLGLIYAKGERAKKNDSLAFQWFMKAAESGDARGMYFVGAKYYYGSGCEKNIEEAVKWLEKASEVGEVMAQDMLGVFYLNGEGVERNPQKGYELISTAAKNGDAHSQYILAVMYARGKEIPFDREKAIYWFDKAVEKDKEYEEHRSELMEHIKASEGSK